MSVADPFSSRFAWPAPAKINLFLHITGRRADGYHELQTLFQFLDWGDRLWFQPRGDGLCRRLEGPAEVDPEQDLVVRAARLLSQRSGAGLGVDIRIDKQIPLGSGLGGGSSDAATTLVALNRLWNLGLPPDELAALGLRLGADVPVFLRAEAAWAEGVGERLQAAAPEEGWLLLLCPPVAVSTAEIFSAPALRRDTAPIRPQDWRWEDSRNDCEPITSARYPEVAAALAWLRQRAPARMSGTGASVFGRFADPAAARAAAAEAPAAWRPRVVRGLNRSPLAAILRGL